MSAMNSIANFPNNYTNPLVLALPTLTCFFYNLKSYTKDGKKDYSGYQILKIANISTVTTQEYAVLQKLYNIEGLFNFLSGPYYNRPTNVMLCPQQVANVTSILNYFKIPFQVIRQDLQKDIDAEKLRNDEIEKANPGMDWKSYHNFSTIIEWIDLMAFKYPGHVSTEIFGKSFEGRPLKVMKIFGSGQFGRKHAVWIDGGIHAREWISPAVTSFIANEVIHQMITNSGPATLMDWYIIPVLNPDGYVYSHTTDRMWRKTRSKDLLSIFRKCIGVDPNRNFDYKWGGKGASKNPCAEDYRDPSPASENEIHAVQNYIYNFRQHIKLLFTFHSYSQLMFTPWGYDKVPLDDKMEMESLGKIGVAGLGRLYGTKYEVGASPEFTKPGAGGTEDWTKAVAKIKFSYNIELPDKGDKGFLLDQSKIIPTGRETFEGVTEMVKGVVEYYKTNGN